MSLQGTVEVLKRMPLFGNVDEARLRIIAMSGARLKFRPGERLAEKGEDGDAAFIVLDGTVDVMVPTPGGEVSVAALGPGELVGEMAVLTGQPRSTGIVARSDLTVLQLEGSVLLRLLQEFPDIALQVIRILAKRLEETTARSV